MLSALHTFRMVHELTDTGSLEKKLTPELTLSLKVPPMHRPTWSVMRSVSDSQWVGVVEGALLQGQLAACE